MTAFSSALFTGQAQIDQIREALLVLLREGFAEDAADRLEEAIGALEELGHPIVPLCHELARHGIGINGWEKIAAGLTRLYKSDQPITAIGIDLSAHDDGEPGEPCIETNFYSDEAFPFSKASRAGINAGYDGSSSEWAGKFEDIDGTFTTMGLAELHTALRQLDAQIAAGEADGADHDAYFIGSAYMAVLLHLAIRDVIMVRGLPRALAVLVGSNEYYPFFDAPVVSTEEYRQVAPVKSAAAVAPADMEEAEPEAASEELSEEDRVEFEEALPRAVGDDWAADAPASRAAEAVEDIEVPAEDVEAPVAEDVAEQPDEIEVEDLSDNAEDVTEQPEIAEPSDTDPADEAEPSGEADSQDEPEDEGISSGAALRRKLSQRSDEQPEQAAPEAPEAESTGLFKKLFRRKRA